MTQPYVPSGRIAPQAYIYFLAVILVVCPLTALGYAYGIRYIPYVYFRFIMPFLAAGAVALTMSQLVIKAGKVRNETAGTVMSLLAVALTLALSWFIWLMLLEDQGFQMERLLHLITHPGETFEVWKRVYTAGTFSFVGITISGLFQLLIWLGECLIFVVIGSLAASQAATHFNEESMTWLRERHFLIAGFVESPSDFSQRLEQADAGILQALGEGNQMKQHSHITLYDFGTHHYITVVNRMPRPGNEGIEYDEIPVATRLRLSPEFFARLAPRTSA